MVTRLLGGYPNLSVDISWIVYDDVVCRDLEPRTHWLETIDRYPGRFYLGSDLCGHFDHLGKTMARYNGLLRRLSPRVRRRVASENAEALWFGGAKARRRSGRV
jgi:hypothetical protein